MAQQIITIEDLQQFRLQLLEDLKTLIQPANNPSQKEWLKSSDVRRPSKGPLWGKMLGISHGTLQNLRIKGVLPYQKLGDIMFYRYEDNTNSQSVGELVSRMVVKDKILSFAVDTTMRGPMIDLAGIRMGIPAYSQ